MPFSTAAKNLMLDAMDESLATGIDHLSLHTAYSNSGANEVTGGSPAYARQPCAFGAAASAQKALTGTETFDVPAGTTVAFVGCWDAVTAGTFLGMFPAGGGTLKGFSSPVIADDTLEAPAHGLSTGNQVVVWAIHGSGLPTGLTEGTIYHVISATTDDFQLSLTSGGAAINITAVGKGLIQQIVPEVFAGQGTYQVSAFTLDFTVH